jgi:hypothetical protein
MATNISTYPPAHVIFQYTYQTPSACRKRAFVKPNKPNKPNNILFLRISNKKEAKV